MILWCPLRTPSEVKARLLVVALIPSLVLALPRVWELFALLFLNNFSISLSKIIMSTFCGLAGLFSRRSARFLFSRNVSNNLVGCCRSRSIFAATTRGASQSKGLVIACACAKVCACEKHNYSRGLFFWSVLLKLFSVTKAVWLKSKKMGNCWIPLHYCLNLAAFFEERVKIQ